VSIYQFIGERIRELREEHGLSQDALAKSVGVSTNTISRWETATYKPNLDDIQKLATFFKIRLLSLLPPEEEPLEVNQRQALLSATGDLHDEDIQELIEFAEWRRARRRLGSTSKRR